jgi:hypothetical protein
MWKLLILLQVMFVVALLLIWNMLQPSPFAPEPDEILIAAEEFEGIKLLAPREGIYHGAFPDFGPTEDVVTAQRIQEFESLVGKEIAWAYFSDNWFNGIRFPAKEVEIIAAEGITPFIRMMPRSAFYEKRADPLYTLEDIANGRYDIELQEWARAAKSIESPLIVEFGTEVNGNWFSWNATWNGREKGAAVFQDAYRHIIDLFGEEGVENITWVFHVDAQGDPQREWNAIAAYYPGDEHIDWIGISVYGAQKKGDAWQSFTQVLDEAYGEVAAISRTKPLALLEFGVREDRRKPTWITQALEAIRSNRYPRIKAISYWHSDWENKDGTISSLRLDSSSEALRAYERGIQNSLFLEDLDFSNLHMPGI